MCAYTTAVKESFEDSLLLFIKDVIIITPIIYSFSNRQLSVLFLFSCKWKLSCFFFSKKDVHMGISMFTPHLRGLPWLSEGGKAWKGGKMGSMSLTVFSLFLHFAVSHGHYRCHHELPSPCMLSSPQHPWAQYNLQIRVVLFLRPEQKVIELTWRGRIWNAPFGHMTVSWI